MTQVSSYFASLGVAVDKASFSRADKYFEKLEQRLLRLGRSSNAFAVQLKFSVDTGKARIQIQKDLAQVSRGLTLRLNRFSINTKALTNLFTQSLSKNSVANRIRVTATIAPAALAMMRTQVAAALNGISINPRVTPRITPGAVRQPNNPTGGGSGGNSRARAHGFAGGMVGGGAMNSFARFGMGAIPILGGAYGLAAMNNSVQQNTALGISQKAVFGNAMMPDGSTKDVFPQADAFIRKHADHTGLRLNSITPLFQSFMGAAMPSMGYEIGSEVFGAFSEFGVSRGASAEDQKRALRAVSQMSGKGQVYSEELTGQLAEATGFSEMVTLFAQAWQQKTGGGLQGQKAIEMLRADAKKGKVFTADILPLILPLLRGRIGNSVIEARDRAQGWQGRAGTATDDYMKVFSAEGGDQGFATMWRTVTELITRSKDGAQTMAGYFLIASGTFGNMLLNVQEVMELLNGTMSKDNIFNNLISPDSLATIAGIKTDVMKIVQEMNAAMPWNVVKEWSGAVFSATNTFRDILLLIRAATSGMLTIYSAMRGDWNGIKTHGSATLNAAGTALFGEENVNGLKSRVGSLFGDGSVLERMGTPQLPTGMYAPSNLPPNTPQIGPNTPAASQTTNNNNQPVSVVYNITVPKTSDIEPAVSGASRGTGGVISSLPIFKDVNMGAFPKSGS